MVSDTWSRDLERLQVRARKARESMKKERLEQALPKTTFEEADKGIPYQDCVMIVNNLMKEDSSTNFLGQYKDASLYAWDKIKRDYEKSGLCIAQIARDLISLCKYEIPALRDELEEMQKREGHSKQNLTSLDRSLKIAANELSASCEDIGIETNDVAGLNSESQIESRILRSVHLDKLREELQTYRIAAREKSIQDACNLYRDFTKYLSSVSSDNEASTTTTLMNTLRKIQNEDEPTSLESCVQFQVEQDVVEEKEEEVDAVFDIDWGITLEDEEGDVEETSNGDEIDWGITMEDDDNETEDMEITVEDEGEEKKEEEITTSLVDPSIRETLWDDLEELICFLTQRTNELKESESGYAGKDVPQSVKTQTLHGIQNVLDDVKSLRDRLTSPDFRAKILIASSLSYRNRLAKQILSLRHRTVKLEGKKIQALDRRNAIRSSISDLEPRVLRTVTVAKKLRSELETLISSSLNDRKIKIMSTGLR